MRVAVLVVEVPYLAQPALEVAARLLVDGTAHVEVVVSMSPTLGLYFLASHAYVTSMKKNTLLIIGLVLVCGIGAAAYGGFYSPAAEGTVYPAPANAGLTCYPLDSGFQLAQVSARADVLATFIQKDAQGKQTGICFLRTPAANPEWTQIALPPAPTPVSPVPQTCPGYPVAPFPGAACVNGGWIPGQ